MLQVIIFVENQMRIEMWEVEDGTFGPGDIWNVALRGRPIKNISPFTDSWMSPVQNQMNPFHAAPPSFTEFD